MSVRILVGDCMARMAEMASDSVDACVTDPPYHLTTGKKGGKGEKSVNLDSPAGRARITAGFMGKAWDGGDVAFRPETWAEVLRVLKPGAHLVAFGAPRNYHRLACAIEDAGFEIRDSLMWVFGSGFPKSLDVSKAIDKAAGAQREVIAEGRPVKRMIPGADQNKEGWEKNNGREFVPTETAPATAEARQWDGWGTALKPAYEPIILARKPLTGTVAANVLAHGVGAINIDGCRVDFVGDTDRAAAFPGGKLTSHGGGSLAGPGSAQTINRSEFASERASGRWPANLIHDGSEEVLATFPDAPGRLADASTNADARKTQNVYGAMKRGSTEASAERTYEEEGSTNFAMKPGARRNDAGSAARFFYCAKASAKDRAGSKHPTVKPIALMRYLCRLITPPGGIILDPFAGSSTTGEAAAGEGFDAILIEREPEYAADIERRMAAFNESLGLFSQVEKA